MSISTDVDPRRTTTVCIRDENLALRATAKRGSTRPDVAPDDVAPQPAPTPVSHLLRCPATPLPGARRYRWAIVVVNLADGSATRFEAPADPDTFYIH